MLSTGMSTEKNIESAVLKYNPDLLFHTNSTYPSKVNELNLNYIKTLKDKYSNKIIGYSGHEFGLVPTFAAVALELHTSSVISLLKELCGGQIKWPLLSQLDY